MRRAEKVEAQQPKADAAAIERDAKDAGYEQPSTVLPIQT